ncbi:hypothetical protein [Rhodococcus xishaensis]|uniref:hypothetical protein n=1 Tax=Rhodococcus xishaensis TaxID=2487364 RepID=UPI001F44FA32|nr:hypothetical protein [Rhodococcus xishaensis]
MDKIPEIADALVVGVDLADGAHWMPLVAVLLGGTELAEGLKDRIRGQIRERVSPRHLVRSRPPPLMVRA